MPASSRPKRRRSYHKSGAYTLKKAVQVLGSRALPTKRTALGRELRAWRDSLVTDLGGPDAVSTQQVALVEKAVTQKLICDSLDAYVLQMGSLVDKRHRTLWPIVRERTAQVNLLRDLLRDLGLERRAKQLDLAAQLAALHDSPGRATSPGRTERPPAAPNTAAAQPAPAEGADAVPVREDDATEPEPEAEP
jgi:hypothetical protein